MASSSASSSGAKFQIQPEIKAQNSNLRELDRLKAKIEELEIEELEKNVKTLSGPENRLILYVGEKHFVADGAPISADADPPAESIIDVVISDLLPKETQDGLIEKMKPYNHLTERIANLGEFPAAPEVIWWRDWGVLSTIAGVLLLTAAVATLATNWSKLFAMCFVGAALLVFVSANTGKRLKLAENFMAILESINGIFGGIGAAPDVQA